VDQPVLARVKIEAPTPAVHPAHPLDVSLDDRARLIGYDLPAATISAGSDLPITLYWQALKGLDGDYTVFIHLLDDQDNLVGQGDGPPLDNWYPTSLWAAGESLADHHLLHIPAEVKPGSYRIVVGLYDPATGRRLPVVNDKGEITGDRVVVTRVQVPP
jgi:hypothetical protein